MDAIFEIQRRLNVQSTNYVANVVLNEALLERLAGSVRGLVAVDTRDVIAKAKKNPNLKSVKFVDARSRPYDDSVFDRVVCLYLEEFFGQTLKDFEEGLETLARMADNKGLVLIVGVPDGNRKKSNGIIRYADTDFIRWFNSKNITDFWTFQNAMHPDRYDVLFRVRKYDI